MSYTYTPGGKLKTETNARGNVTTYSHDAAGRQVAAQVNDNGLTPTKTFSYDQLDRQASAAMEGVAAYRYVYNNQNQVTEELITIPTVNGNLERSLVRAYDSHGRLTGYQLKHGDAVEQEITYAYAPAGQLAGVTADGKEFTYSYLPNMPKLVSRTTGPLHTVTHTYEASRNVLTGKTNRWKNKVDMPVISAYIYTVNSLGQRVSVTTMGEAFASVPADWAWGYDVLGQVTSANEDHYSYDQIGNRRMSRKGDAPETVYTANELNQYARTGTAAPAYDADGNQLTGLTPTESLPARDTLTFTYNAENRPVKAAQNGEVRESYSYDHMGRRIHKGDTVTLYDGYNAIAEYKSHTRTLKTTHAWGNDLSGTAQGAGGVGGLLSVTEHDRQLPLTSYPCYDGNGNITEYLTEEGAGTIAAHYEYDAFGQVSRKTGNRDYGYQFSTKPSDSRTGLLYYNYRHYNPRDGRWINRDPIAEEGGLNLYGFVVNQCINKFDYLGTVVEKYKDSPKNLDLSPVKTGQILANGRNTMPADASGLALPSANNNGAQISENKVGSTTYYHLSYNAKLGFNLYYNTDRISNPDIIVSPNSIYPTVREHEYHHVSISIEWWNLYVDKFWIYDDKNYCSEDCASTMAKIIMNMIGMCMEESHIENCEFDMFEYGYRNPAALARLQKEIANSQKIIETCKGEIRKYVDQYNEKKCSDDTGVVKELKYENFID